ncbi:MAG: DUF4212 domain-containing protein [Bacteroidota bacterium]
MKMTKEAYWQRQLKRIALLLTVWAVVAFGMAIFGAPFLNQFSFGGVPFGFWMAQQGSIFVFVSLIWIYAYFSDKADQEAGLAETEGSVSAAGEGH